MISRFIKRQIIARIHSSSDTVNLFARDLSLYFHKKLSMFASNFEFYKGYLVDILMAKRGRYHGPFLNLSLFVLVAAGILAAPHISSYYPTLANDNTLASVAPPSASVADFNLDEISMATQKSEKPRDQVLDYEVRSGDAVSSIASKFDVSEDTIKWANGLKEKNPLLKPGQILKIPPVTGVVHKVKQGETVYSIAEKYDTESQKIVNFPFNDFVDLDNFTLAVGQTLVVPDGVVPEEILRPVTPRPLSPQYIAGTQITGKLLFPSTGMITQNPVWYHMALDIANRDAPDVYAAETGQVVYAECLKWGYGCHIIVDHGNNVRTLYAHMMKFYVGVGDGVKRGQAIGRMGSTGRSTGMHLHFEVRINNITVNPWTYLK